MKLRVAPGDGRAFTLGEYSGFSSQPIEDLHRLLQTVEDQDNDLFKSLAEIVVVSKFRLPAFAVLQSSKDEYAAFVFGDLQLVSQNGETLVDGSQSATWIERRVAADQVRGAAIGMAADQINGTYADSDLQTGYVPAGGIVFGTSQPAESTASTSTENDTAAEDVAPPSRTIGPDRLELSSTPVDRLSAVTSAHAAGTAPSPTHGSNGQEFSHSPLVDDDPNQNPFGRLGQQESFNEANWSPTPEPTPTARPSGRNLQQDFNAAVKAYQTEREDLEPVDNEANGYEDWPPASAGSDDFSHFEGYDSVAPPYDANSASNGAEADMIGLFGDDPAENGASNHLVAPAPNGYNDYYSGDLGTLPPPDFNHRGIPAPEVKSARFSSPASQEYSDLAFPFGQTSDTVMGPRLAAEQAAANAEERSEPAAEEADTPEVDYGCLQLDDGQVIIIHSNLYLGRYPTKSGLPSGYQPVVVRGEHVSRVHWALVVSETGELTAKDLGSTGGTYIEDATVGKRIALTAGDEYPLRPESTVRFGDRWAKYVTEPVATDGSPLSGDAAQQNKEITTRIPAGTAPSAVGF